MFGISMLRIAIALFATLAVDFALVVAFLWWTGDGDVNNLIIGILVVWALCFGAACRNIVARAIFYFIGNGVAVDLMVQHMRLKGYPRDIPAFNWFSYFEEAMADDNLPREVLADMAATNGGIAGTKQTSIIAGAIQEHLIDRAVLRYLA